jgi:glutamyl-tRNA reductase
VRARALAANGQQGEYVAAREALYGITVDKPSAASEAECPVDHGPANPNQAEHKLPQNEARRHTA